MSDTVIKVDNLSKGYRIGTREGYQTFRETLADAAKAPFVRLRSALRKAHKAKEPDSQLPAPSSSLHAHSSEPPAPSSPLPAHTSMLSSRGDDHIWALKDVSFEVKRGEVVGIIGRNGAGKSTLLKILSKITEPTEGRVELKGRVGSLLEVGTGFHPELTGHENVYLYGAILGMDRWEVTRKFDEIVAFAELEKFIGTPVKRYSSGMYMRLAFAVAAHLEPEILLIDEVLAVGDVAFQKKCLGQMGKISSRGRTVLFVSHNMSAVEALCSNSIFLNQGRIEFTGCTNHAISIYLSDNITVQNIPIRYRNDREGAGNVRFTNIVVDAPEGIATGKNIAFLADYETIKDVSIKEFGLSIWSDREIRLISLSSEFKGQLGRIPGYGIVSCEILNFPLVAGHYQLNFFIRSTVGIEDYLIKALSFYVDSGDYFKTGKAVDPRWGAIAVDHNWNLQKGI